VVLRSVGAGLYLIQKPKISFYDARRNSCGRPPAECFATARGRITSLDRNHHPLANIFPLIEGDAFGALVSDIRVNGLRDAITLYDGKILDGRNRYRACRDAGVEPRFECPDIDDPLAFVVGKNALRRHLNESQRSMAAAKVANMRQGERTDLPSKGGKSFSQNDAAKLFNVGTSSVQRAAAVIKHGSAELQQAVERGEISVSAAAEQLHAERAAKKSEEQRQAGAEGAKLGQAGATEIEPRPIPSSQPAASETSNNDAPINAEGETAADQEQPDGGHVEPGREAGDAEHGETEHADVAEKQPLNRSQQWIDAARRAHHPLQELITLQREYRSQLEGIVENRRGTSLAEKLQTICDLNLRSAFETVEEAEAVMSHLQTGGATSLA
jgi:hypothetical protein